MARSISRLVLAAAYVVTLPGCGSGVGDPSAGRAGSTVPNPYVACNQVGIPDEQVDVMLQGNRQLHNDGYLASQALEDFSAGCSVNPYMGYWDCMACASAVVDAVY
jgi:hypothetical protein